MQLQGDGFCNPGSAGLNTVDRLDHSTIAISGEVEGGDYVIQYKTLGGATIRSINMGVCQVGSREFLDS